MRRWEITIWQDVETKEEAEEIDSRVQTFLAEHPEFQHNANYRVLESLVPE